MAVATNLAQVTKSLAALYASPTDHQHVLVAKRFLRPLVSPLLPQMGITEQTSTPVQWLDLASGSGVVPQELQAVLSRDVLENSTFLLSDLSPSLVELLNTRIAAEKWVGTSARVLNAMDTGLQDNSYTHVSVSMGLHLISKPNDVLKEAIRILKPGGIFGATTPVNDPSHSMWQPDLSSAFASFPFEAPFPNPCPAQLHDQGHWSDASWVELHLKEQGFQNVMVTVIRGKFHVEGAEDFMGIFGGMLMWLMNGWWSEELRAEHPVDEVKELTQKYLEEKHGGKGWDLGWSIMYATGEVQK
ncbi:hypothetical protein S7711_05781 [Stachybotrys chartarum IBT 7711]|uniref:Methyltransferase type 11 domain-containing protein n=1 Tax=Stachybotrys chartarum (strain CBS 109288 / IBT 7711) TaxID=1280523 RepID=A0A084ATH0_STACB|nr:hypothetical protein S7711_05781 [Stachybotrys chartarum IBT 7711]